MLTISIMLILSVQPRINQWCAVLGAFLPYGRTLWESDSVQAPLYFFQELLGYFQRFLMRFSQPKNDPHTQYQSDRSPNHQYFSDDEALRQERAEREREARTRREEAERHRREAQEKANTRTAPHERSPEEILGLQPNWTQEDLKHAYRSEAGRTHPDKWVGKPECIVKAMEEEYKNIQEAYRVLKS